MTKLVGLKQQQSQRQSATRRRLQVKHHQQDKKMRLDEGLGEKDERQSNDYNILINFEILKDMWETVGKCSDCGSNLNTYTLENVLFKTVSDMVLKLCIYIYYESIEGIG